MDTIAMKSFISVLAAMAIAGISPTMAFVTPVSQTRANKIMVAPTSSNVRFYLNNQKRTAPTKSTTATTTTTSLQMSYQLPPSPQGPKGPLEQIQAILPTIGTIFLVALFFASPLGGIFFAITNSLFVLALLTPFILFVGFQIWSALYTIEAPCPSCGAIPVRVLKNGEPSVCLNCGAFSRANVDGDGLELCNNPNDVMSGGGSLFDALFGQGGGNGVSDFGPDFDIMGGGGSPTKTNNSADEQAKKAKRQGTIIDVDVERD